MKRLKGSDAVFLYRETPTSLMHTLKVLIFSRKNPQVDFETIYRDIKKRVDANPLAHQRIIGVPFGIHHPVMVDDPDFDLKAHVFRAAIPAPGTEHELNQMVAQIGSTQLDRSRPLWELWVLEGLEGNRIAFVHKIHHCMADGISGNDLIAMLLKPSPDATSEAAPRWFPRPSPSGSQLLGDEIRHRVLTPLALLDQARDALRDPLASIESARKTAAAIAETVGAGLRPASRTPLNPAHIGPHRRFDWIAFDLDDVKEIKNRLGDIDYVICESDPGLRD